MNTTVSDMPPDMTSALIKLVVQGGPFVIAAVVLWGCCYFTWVKVIKPLLDTNAEQMRNHVVASENNKLAAQANERLGQTLQNSVTRLEAMR